MIAAVYARKSTEQIGVADDQKSVTRVFVGNGGKIRRAAIAYALNELIGAAERHEGIES
jgi:hypothetical protein